MPYALNRNLRASCHSNNFLEAWGANRGRGATTDNALPSLLAILCRTLSPCMFVSVCEYTLFLFASIHLSNKQSYWHKKRCTVQRHANTMRNGNARGDGNTRRDCWMKIESLVALTVKHPKTLLLAPRSLRCFLNPLVIFDLSTPALSLFLKSSTDFCFPRTIHPTHFAAA